MKTRLAVQQNSVYKAFSELNFKENLSLRFEYVFSLFNVPKNQQHYFIAETKHFSLHF